MSRESNIHKEEGLHYYNLGRYEKALECFCEALSLSPQNAYVKLYMAYCMFSLDRYKECRDLCQQVLAMKKYEFQCFDILAAICEHDKDYVEAENFYLEALRIDPNSVMIMVKYATVLTITGYEEKASALMQEAIRIEPNNEYVLMSLVHSFQAKGKKKKMYDVMKQIFVGSSDEYSRLIIMGCGELYIKKYKEASRLFRQAYVMDPTKEEALDLVKYMEEKTSLLYLPIRILEYIGGFNGLVFLYLLLMVVAGIMHRYQFMIITTLVIFVYQIYGSIVSKILVYK